MAELRHPTENDVNGNETVRRAPENERRDRHGGLLYPLLLVAAIAVIVFSIIGIATMTGVMPSSVGRDAAIRPSSGHVDKGGASRIQSPRRDPVPQPGNPRSATLPARAPVA
jgi:hypothetical protein